MIRNWSRDDRPERKLLAGFRGQRRADLWGIALSSQRVAVSESRFAGRAVEGRNHAISGPLFDVADRADRPCAPPSRPGRDLRRRAVRRPAAQRRRAGLGQPADRRSAPRHPGQARLSSAAPRVRRRPDPLSRCAGQSWRVSYKMTNRSDPGGRPWRPGRSGRPAGRSRRRTCPRARAGARRRRAQPVARGLARPARGKEPRLRRGVRDRRPAAARRAVRGDFRRLAGRQDHQLVRQPLSDLLVAARQGTARAQGRALVSLALRQGSEPAPQAAGLPEPERRAPRGHGISRSPGHRRDRGDRLYLRSDGEAQGRPHPPGPGARHRARTDPICLGRGRSHPVPAVPGVAQGGAARAWRTLGLGILPAAEPDAMDHRTPPDRPGRRATSPGIRRRKPWRTRSECPKIRPPQIDRDNCPGPIANPTEPLPPSRQRRADARRRRSPRPVGCRPADPGGRPGPAG